MSCVRIGVSQLQIDLERATLPMSSTCGGIPFRIGVAIVECKGNEVEVLDGCVSRPFFVQGRGVEIQVEEATNGSKHSQSARSSTTSSSHPVFRSRMTSTMPEQCQASPSGSCHSTTDDARRHAAKAVMGSVALRCSLFQPSTSDHDCITPIALWWRSLPTELQHEVMAPSTSDAASPWCWYDRGAMQREAGCRLIHAG